MRPIHFFSETSWTYAQSVLKKNKSHGDALRRASTRWTGSDYRRGEREDAYYHLCFGRIDPIDSEFQHIAIEVFGPILRAQVDIEL